MFCVTFLCLTCDRDQCAIVSMVELRHTCYNLHVAKQFVFLLSSLIILNLHVQQMLNFKYTFSHVIPIKKNSYKKGNKLVKWKFNHWWSTILPISTKGTISCHLNILNTKQTRHMMLEI